MERVPITKSKKVNKIEKRSKKMLKKVGRIYD
jgi:hypothetical protein